MQFDYQFVPWGAALEPRAGRIAVDVGNQLIPGVIDHHQPDADHGCAASLIVRDPDLVLAHAAAYPGDRWTIAMHRDPDLDCVASALLVRELLSTGRLPDAAPALARYVTQVDSATLPRARATSIGLHSVYLAATALLRDAGATGEALFRAEVERGLDLVARALERFIDAPGGAAGPREFGDASCFAGSPALERELAFLGEDLARYQRDRARAEASRVFVLAASEGKTVEVDCLTVVDPTSRLFKDLARGDREGSSGGMGFEALHVVYADALPDGDRHVLSVDPSRRLSLRGLGGILEAEEVRARTGLGRRRSGPGRWEDVETADPWYDGRNPLHRHTIVDTPARGTVLDRARVSELFHADPRTDGAWQRAGLRPRTWFCPPCGDHVPRKLRCERHDLERVPSVIGGYTLLRWLGGGGMGDVYVVHDPIRDREAALKVVRAEFAAERVARERFVREARIASAVLDRHLVTTYDRGQDEDVGEWYVMELLDGRTLAAALFDAFEDRPDGPFSPPIAHHTLLQVCDGLAALHGRGILHRDLKPSNVFLVQRDGRLPLAKLLDFGVATQRAVGDLPLTGTGMICGTVPYLPPEALDGRTSARTDIYALGCVIYESVVGYPPFRVVRGEITPDVTMCMLRMEGTPDRADVARRAGAPLAELVDRLLQPAPADRPSNVRSVRGELDAAFDADRGCWRGMP